ncbi:MAG: hypothetical protein H7Y17_07110 [Chlorobia bacterium]|nr:hypothetical protein [Fimbriimonadaceae bacterium]
MQAIIVSEQEGVPSRKIDATRKHPDRFALDDASGVIVQFRRNGLPVTRLPGAVSAKLLFPTGAPWPIKRYYVTESDAVFRIPKGYDKVPDHLNLIVSPAETPDRVLATLRITKFAPAQIVIGPAELRMKEPRWKIVPKENLRADILVIGQEPGKQSVVDVLRTTHVDYTKLNRSMSIRFDGLRTSGKLLENNSVFEAGMREIELEETEAKRFEVADLAEVKGLYLEEVQGKTVLAVPRAVTVKTKMGNTLEIPAQRAAPFRQGQVKSRNAQLQANYRFVDKRLPGFINYAQLRTISPSPGDFGVGSIKLNLDNYAAAVSGNAFSSRRYTWQNVTLSFQAASKVKVGALPPLKFAFDVQIWKKVATYKGIVSVPVWPLKHE